MISIKHTVKLVPALAGALGNKQTDLLQAIHTILTDAEIEEIEQEIDQVVNEEVVFATTSIGLRNQRCYAVKAGFNSLLDVARQTYKVGGSNKGNYK